MSHTNQHNNPIKVQAKIGQALTIIQLLGLPRAQQNERSALTLLALLDLSPDGAWKDIERPLLGVTPIIDWCEKVYGKKYAPNTRETFRRQTLHQFVDAGFVLYNPDNPKRPVNSPKACYQITPELHNVLSLYETKAWDIAMKKYLEGQVTLQERYARSRKMHMIPLKITGSKEIKLTPGAHSQLIKDIITAIWPQICSRRRGYLYWGYRR